MAFEKLLLQAFVIIIVEVDIVIFLWNSAYAGLLKMLQYLKHLRIANGSCSVIGIVPLRYLISISSNSLYMYSIVH